VTWRVTGSAAALGLACVLAVGCAALPESEVPYPSLVGPSSVEGWRSKHALFFVVPVDDQGVVLIDTGYDEEGDDLRKALGGRTVRALFITHAHVDHYSGAHTLGPVPTFAGEGDVARILGHEVSGGLITGLADRLLPHPTPPITVTGVADGALITAEQVGAPGRWTVEAIAAPGHTPGSTVWRLGDMLFSGDAFLVSDDGEVGFAPPGFSDDEAQERRSVGRVLERLGDREVRALFDGHAGRSEDPRGALRHFVDSGAVASAAPPVR
jgi:hydroxyacylglutathione hydrolase